MRKTYSIEVNPKEERLREINRNPVEELRARARREHPDSLVVQEETDFSFEGNTIYSLDIEVPDSSNVQFRNDYIANIDPVIVQEAQGGKGPYELDVPAMPTSVNIFSSNRGTVTWKNPEPIKVKPKHKLTLKAIADKVKEKKEEKEEREELPTQVVEMDKEVELDKDNRYAFEYTYGEQEQKQEEQDAEHGDVSF